MARAGGGAAQHLFLQTLMRRGYMPEEDGVTLLTALGLASAGGGGYDEYISDLNAQVEPMHFRVMRIRSPLDKQRYVGFVNRWQDDETRGATEYRSKEGKADLAQIGYLRAAIECIAAAEHPGDWEGGCPVADAGRLLNLGVGPPAEPSQEETRGDRASQAQGGPDASPSFPHSVLGPSQREGLLRRFVADGWLATVPERNRELYSLGPRAYLELSRTLSAEDPSPQLRSLLEPMFA